MAKPELGLKRICLGCGKRFYDLNRIPVSCPSCGKEFDPSASSRGSRSKQTGVHKDHNQEKKHQDSGIQASKEMDLDDDSELEDIDVLDDDSAEDEAFDEDMEDEDDLIGSIDKTSDKDE